MSAEVREKIVALRAEREEVNGQIEALRIRARQLSAALREAEDTEELSRAARKLASRRGHRMRVDPATVAMSPKG